MAPKIARSSSTKTYPFTFKDSGVTLTLKKVSPYLLAEARAALNKDRPKPPTRVVTEDGPLKGAEEVMDRDPDYIEKVREWEGLVDEKVMNLQIRRGVVEIGDPDWKEAVADLRADMELIGASSALPDDDIVAYVCYVASATAQDLNELIMEISSRSEPTPEAVEASKDSFRDGVSE